MENNLRRMKSSVRLWHQTWVYKWFNWCDVIYMYKKQESRNVDLHKYWCICGVHRIILFFALNHIYPVWSMLDLLKDKACKSWSGWHVVAGCPPHKQKAADSYINQQV